METVRQADSSQDARRDGYSYLEKKCCGRTSAGLEQDRQQSRTREEQGIATVRQATTGQGSGGAEGRQRLATKQGQLAAWQGRSPHLVQGHGGIGR